MKDAKLCCFLLHILHILIFTIRLKELMHPPFVSPTPTGQGTAGLFKALLKAPGGGGGGVDNTE